MSDGYDNDELDREKSEIEVEELRAAKDQAYRERNLLVAAVSKLFPASLERHPDGDKTWEDDWRWIVFIDLPGREGQVSWHIHDSELPAFAHLPRHAGRVWDGHTTEEKYCRLAGLVRACPRCRRDDGIGMAAGGWFCNKCGAGFDLHWKALW